MTSPTNATEVQADDFAQRCWAEAKAQPGFVRERARIFRKIADGSATSLTRDDLERIRQTALES